MPITKLCSIKRTTEYLDARNDSGMKGKETCSDHNSDNNQDEASLTPKRMPRKRQRREEFGPSRIQPVGLAGSFAGSLVNDLASSDTDDEVIQIKSDEQAALSIQEEFN